MQAGELLAQRLAAFRNRSDVIVLALPRGGVPVGFAIANALDAPLDILLVRKLGVPGHEEYAMGAIASGGRCVLQADVLHMLGIPRHVVQAVARRELQEIQRRETLYRAGLHQLDVRDHAVILVDDGVATGSTMLAAVRVVREARPANIVLAVPVAPAEIGEALRSEVDQMIVLLTPEPFHAVGRWYEEFAQVSDDEVTLLLGEAHRMRTRLEPASAADRAGPNGKMDAKRH